jgi:hypothetical protein
VNITTQEVIFPVTKTVWQYDTSIEYGPYEIELFFEQFGLKVVPLEASGLTNWAENWLCFRSGDGEFHMVQPYGYIVIEGFKDATAMTMQEFEAVGTTPAPKKEEVL